MKFLYFHSCVEGEPGRHIDPNDVSCVRELEEQGQKSSEVVVKQGASYLVKGHVAKRIEDACEVKDV